jgi:hypothetical protein
MTLGATDRWRTNVAIKVTPEQQLGFLERDVFPLVTAVRKGYDYDPGSSDLDDEQPIIVRMELGEYRRAVRLYYELTKVAR